MAYLVSMLHFMIEWGLGDKIPQSILVHHLNIGNIFLTAKIWVVVRAGGMVVRTYRTLKIKCQIASFTNSLPPGWHERNFE